MPPLAATGRRAWWCDVCGQTVHWSDLRMQYREWCEPVGSNYCLHSSYNSAFWSCSATDAGQISMGPLSGHFYGLVSLSQPTTVTDKNGAQTWTGNGTIRSTVAVDGSTWDTFTFGNVVGPHQNPTASTTYSAVMGLCNSGGTPITVEKTYSNQNGMRHIWFAKTIADVAAPSTLYFYITVTVASAAEKWYADMFRCEKNVTAPRDYLSTSGAAVNRTQPTLVSGYAAVCPKCVLPVNDRWSKQLPPPERIFPIPVDPLVRSGGR